jgi:hypothetical protein
MLGIRPRRMAATTGLAATAASRLEADPVWHELMTRLGRWTAEAQIISGLFEGLWGYEFDVQTRWSFYSAGTPNIIATSLAAHGCLDAKVLEEHRERQLSSGLLRTFSRGRYFAYTPESSTLIHNANLIGAALAARLSSSNAMTKDLAHCLRESAVKATTTTVQLQRRDGSWPYGEGPGLGWVDGYHTAYSLLALDEAAKILELDVEPELMLGAEYYFTKLFRGAKPLFYGTRHRGPSDINNVATGLRAAVWGAKRGIVAADFPTHVFRYLCQHFWDRGNYFRAQAWGQIPTARLDYPRWGGAPALDALTAYVARAPERI